MNISSNESQDTAIYDEQNVRIDRELSDKISAFLGRKLELVAVEADDEPL